jgi:transcriptional regulator with GAF, ATPase, and Fis domain
VKWKIYGADGAAALLKIEPTTLVSKMKRLKIEKEG